MATLTGSIAIGWVNRASGKTVTATTAATGYPASNLSTALMSTKWRGATGSLTAQNVDVDLGSSLDIDVIALVGFNGEDDATRSPKTAENSGFSPTEHDPGSGNAWDATTNQALANDTPVFGRNLIYLPGSTLNSRYVRLVLNDSGNPDNRLSASVYWVGPLWQPANSFRIEEDAYKLIYEPVGTPGIERYLRVLEVELHTLTEAEARQIASVCAERLRSKRLLVIPRPTHPENFLSEVIYCTLVELPTLSAIPIATGLRWKVSLQFREVED